ncbi:MAG TPA: HepT-like ribonuclease domain-containing protein [Bacteroidia bacterium]|nr:HepT-like ribonuclease domain-containing protein [Bacteroidia bacterium]
MDDNIRTWLKDIELAISEINSFLPENKSFTDFQKDLRTKRAIERNIEIIGEAFSRITKVDPDINIANIRKIIDTRNRIIHGYDTVSDDILWGIVIRHLPLLKKDIEGLLK